MVRAPFEKLTLTTFLDLPETKPASEYINGQVIPKPMPTGKHSQLQASVVTLINDALRRPKIALALPELRCTFGGYSIVPDVSLLRTAKLFDKPGRNPIAKPLLSVSSYRL